MLASLLGLSVSNPAALPVVPATLFFSFLDNFKPTAEIVKEKETLSRGVPCHRNSFFFLPGGFHGPSFWGRGALRFLRTLPYIKSFREDPLPWECPFLSSRGSPGLPLPSPPLEYIFWKILKRSPVGNPFLQHPTRQPGQNLPELPLAWQIIQ